MEFKYDKIFVKDITWGGFMEFLIFEMKTVCYNSYLYFGDSLGEALKKKGHTVNKEAVYMKNNRAIKYLKKHKID